MGADRCWVVERQRDPAAARQQHAASNASGKRLPGTTRRRPPQPALSRRPRQPHAALTAVHGHAHAAAARGDLSVAARSLRGGTPRGRGGESASRQHSGSGADRPPAPPRALLQPPWPTSSPPRQAARQGQCRCGAPTCSSASTPSSSSTNLSEEPSGTSRPSVSTCSLRAAVGGGRRVRRGPRGSRLWRTERVLSADMTPRAALQPMAPQPQPTTPPRGRASPDALGAALRRAAQAAVQLVGARVHAAVGQQADEVQGVVGKGGGDVLQGAGGWWVSRQGAVR